MQRMKRFGMFGDVRMMAYCVFCSTVCVGSDGKPETQDHCPSKIFLDKPHPSYLPVVPSCYECNQSFSADESYVATIFSCVISESIDPDENFRPKIARLLESNWAIKESISSQIQQTVEGCILMPDWTRVERTVKKLARGHLLHEFHEHFFDEPSRIEFMQLSKLSRTKREEFEGLPPIEMLPEVGSRAFIAVAEDNRLLHSWVVVQENRYRYLTSMKNGIEVRIVFCEEMAFLIEWT